MDINIADIVHEQISADADHKEQHDKNIKKIYNESSPEEKKKIDDIFINLCGWSLETILSGVLS